MKHAAFFVFVWLGALLFGVVAWWAILEAVMHVARMLAVWAGTR